MNLSLWLLHSLSVLAILQGHANHNVGELLQVKLLHVKLLTCTQASMQPRPVNNARKVKASSHKQGHEQQCSLYAG